MAILINNVLWKEETDRYEKGRNDKGPYVKKCYVGPWEASNDFANTLMGGVVLFGGVGGAISRISPQTCPESPNLSVISVDIEPLGEKPPAGGRPDYYLARATVTHGIREWNEFATEDQEIGFPSDGTQPVVLAIQDMDYSDELVQVGGNNSFSFSTAPQTKLKLPVHVHVGRATMKLTRKFVPYLNVPLFMAKLNKLNNNAGFLGGDVGTVRFAGVHTHTEKMSDGTKVKELQYTFEWREHDWNKYPREDTGVFDKIQDTAGNNPYAYADLRPLLA